MQMDIGEAVNESRYTFQAHRSLVFDAQNILFLFSL